MSERSDPPLREVPPIRFRAGDVGALPAGRPGATLDTIISGMDRMSSLPPASTTAADYFGGMRDAYDDLIRRAVPRYAEMTDRLVEYLPAAAARILELGCGTGNLSLRLARRYPDAEATILDGSPEMVELTRARLAEAAPGFVERAQFVVRRFEEIRDLPGPFDLVVSSISLHHVREKGPLYRDIRSLLAPGGRFHFADQMAGATPETHALNWERWLAFCRRPGGCSEEELASLVAHSRAHDHYTPVAEHLRLLESAGFESVDCVWREGMWGIVEAVRG